MPRAPVASQLSTTKTIGKNLLNPLLTLTISTKKNGIIQLHLLQAKTSHSNLQSGHRKMSET
jgi:hypothetical protein